MGSLMVPASHLTITAPSRPAVGRESSRQVRAVVDPVEVILLVLLAASIPTLHLLRRDIGRFTVSLPAVILALYALWAVVAFPGRSVHPAARVSALAIVALMGWSAASLIWSPFPQAGGVAVFWFSSGCAALLFTCRIRPRNLTAATGVLAAIVFALVVYGLYGVANGRLPWFQFASSYVTALGTRNTDAFLIATVLPIPLARLIVGRSWPHKLIAGGVAAADVVAVVLSLSRGQLIALGAGGLAMLVVGVAARVGRRTVALLVAAVGALVAGGYLLQSGFAGHETAVSRFQLTASSQRIPLAGQAVRDGLAHPLTGLGFDNFRLLNALGEDAHDAYLNTFADLGLLGMLLLLVVLLAPLAGYARVLRSHQLSAIRKRILVLQGLGMLVTLIVSGVFETYYKTLDFWLIYLLVMLQLIALHHGPEPDQRADRP